MNKIKFGILSLVVMLGLASCDKSSYEYTPAGEVGEYNIGFIGEQNQVLDASDKSLTVTLSREDATKEVTVPLEPISIPECVESLPKSVTFKAGETTTSFDVALKDNMKFFTNYKLTFKIAEEYTQPYSADAKSPIFDITIMKNDFKTVATGTFKENVLFGSSWDQDLEYSEYLDLYRWTDLIQTGTHFYFHFNGAEGEDQEFWFTDDKGNHVDKFFSGYVHPSYGDITANINEAYEMGYESTEEGDQFYFVCKFTVTAGSFGEEYETYDVTEWYEKPWEKK